jgi:hypothetical protein
MSSEITTAFVQQYKSEVMHLSQQKGSRLQSFVRNESQNGKSAFYDRLGSATAVVKTSRHADTPQIDSAHSRRRVTLADYEWADLIDPEDLRRLLMDPAGPYAEAAAWAMGRAKDDVIIAAADGTAFGGETGSTSIAIGTAQQYACNDATNVTALNVRSLRAIKRKFDANDVDESISRHSAINAEALEALLGETQVTSADYANVKALVMGQVDTFMGFKFHRLERLLEQVDALSGSGSTGAIGSGTSLIGQRRLIFWAQDGLLLATADDVNVKIDPRPDKSYSTQVYASMGIGATRLEEAKVVIGFSKEV